MNRKLLYILSLILVSLSSHAQVCNGIWGTPLLDLTFGQGTASQAWYTPLATYAPGLTTKTTFVSNGGLSAANVSGLVKNTSVFGSLPSWAQKTDHTGDANGLLLGINMPDNIGDTVVQYLMTNLCPNTTLEFSIWLLNLMAKTNGAAGSPGVQYPNMRMRIVDPNTNAVLANILTGNVPIDEVWHQYAVVFSNGSSSSVLLQLINNTQGSGQGNDVALDDIVVRPCVPEVKMMPNKDTVLCDITSLSFTAQITPGIYTPPVYQWEYRTVANSTWIIGQAASSSAAWNFSPGPGTYWVRYRVAPQGLAINGPCSRISDSIKVTFGKTPQVDLGPDQKLCGRNIQLTAPWPGGVWQWSTGAVDSFIDINHSDKYWVKVTDSTGACSSTDTTEIVINATLTVDLGPDQNVCQTNLPYMLMSPQPPGTQYIWSNGITNSAIEIYGGGIFWLHVSKNGCKGADTIKIAVTDQPRINIGPDSIICEQWPITAGATMPGASYLWSTGSTEPYIEIDQTGTYVLALTFDACTVKDTIDITAMPSPDFDLGEDRDICADQVIPLNAIAPNSTIYKWNTGATTPVYNASAPGTYAVTVVSEYGCISNDTVVLKPFAKPTIILGEDTVVCEETPLTLKPIYSINEDEIAWSNGSTGRQIDITQEGTFIVNAKNKCGIVSDTIIVRQIFCDIWVPNAFTPNGDGVNDILKILGNIGRLQDVTFSVYNRWGEMVFNTHDKYHGWDGRQDGVDASLSVYVYVLQFSLDGNPHMMKGNVTLLR